MDEKYPTIPEGYYPGKLISCSTGNYGDGTGLQFLCVVEIADGKLKGRRVYGNKLGVCLYSKAEVRHEKNFESLKKIFNCETDDEFLDFADSNGTTKEHNSFDLRVVHKDWNGKTYSNLAGIYPRREASAPTGGSSSSGVSASSKYRKTPSKLGTTQCVTPPTEGLNAITLWAWVKTTLGEAEGLAKLETACRTVHPGIELTALSDSELREVARSVGMPVAEDVVYDDVLDNPPPAAEQPPNGDDLPF